MADPQGIDTIFSDCESIDFAPAPVVQPTPPPPPTGSDPGTPSSAADHTPPVLSGLKLNHRTLSYRLSERATVKFRIQLKVGRRWKALHPMSRTGFAGLNKLRLSRRGRYRVTAVARDASGNQSKQSVISFRVKR